MNVLIGANGSGKSNFLSAFKLLNFAMTGGFQVFVQEQGGGSKLLHHGPKVTQQILAHLDFESEAGTNSYVVRWVPIAGDRLIFAEEEILFRRPEAPAPRKENLGGGQRESVLTDSANPSAQSKTARFIKGCLERFRVYHFHDTSSTAHIKKLCRVQDNRYLRGDGGNLAAFLHMLRDQHSAHYEKIRRTIKLVAPFFGDFVLQPLEGNGDYMLLEWQEPGSDAYFNASDLSDGTLRFMCLATLLLQPNLPNAIIIDEPELGLHPAAISQIAALMHSAAQETQLVISTQSVTLIDQLGRAEDVIVVEHSPGPKSSSTFRRVNAAELAVWLEDYSLGELWLKNFLGARP